MLGKRAIVEVDYRFIGLEEKEDASKLDRAFDILFEEVLRRENIHKSPVDN